MLDINNYKKILIINRREIGDGLMALGLIKTITILFPNAKIYYALSSQILPLYRTIFWPNIEVVTNEQNSLGLVKFYQPDIAFELLPEKSLHWPLWLIKIFGKCPYVFSHKKNDPENSLPLIQQDINAFFGLLKKEDIYSGELPDYRDYPPVFNFSSDIKKYPRVVLGPGFTGELKKYPLKAYLEICKKIKEHFSEIKILIPLLKEDLKIQEEIKEVGLNLYCDTRVLELGEFPKFMSESLMYIGNDYWTKHLAVAVNTRTYTLFRMESPKVEHPYERVKHPYFYREFPEADFDDQEISPNAVFEGMKKDLEIIMKTFNFLNKTGYKS